MSDFVVELNAVLPTLVKAVFSQPMSKEDAGKAVIRPVKLKGKSVFQLELFRADKVFHRNLEREALLEYAAEELNGKYRQILLTTTCSSSQYVLRRDGSYRKSSKTAVSPPGGEALLTHNREKNYLLCEGENIPALVDLGVFTPDFRVVKSRYDKFKQINRFVELVNDAFEGQEREKITILDFGCGKSYLTFILYYYFSVKRGMAVEIIGYDLKADVVAHCNEIAAKYGYEHLHFVVADVTRDALYDKDIDMVVTLHACDVATDYALYYAIEKKADYIFSVPCCQHEINAGITRGGDLDIFLRHGIIKERMSALLTDSIRAEVLEDMGYKVDLIEFIDFEHSPKNIMIRARRQKAPGRDRLALCRSLAGKYGFQQTLLELCDRKAE